MRAYRLSACAAVIGAASLAPPTAGAQYHGTPTFQIPRISDRDFNFAVADAGGGGTTLLFQWREGIGARTHLVLDGGLTDPGGRAGVRLLLGAGLAHSIHRAQDELPLDMLLTGSVGGAFGEGRSTIRLPFGVTVGHRFLLEAEGPVVLTPYAHPRISLDYCSRCGPRGRGDSDLAVDVDLGVDVELSRALALRASVVLGGSGSNGEDGFGISLVWVPPGLRNGWRAPHSLDRAAFRNH